MAENSCFECGGDVAACPCWGEERKPEPPTLAWSGERPKAAGWYFVRNVPDLVTSNVWRIDEDEMKTQWVESVEFAGPIPEPQEPKL